LATYWNFIIKTWRSGIKKFRNLAILGHFFHGKSCVLDPNHIFQVEIWQNFVQKNKTKKTPIAMLLVLLESA
jgi:hypothetical protein